MLGLTPRRMLGLAIGDKAIHVAEVQGSRPSGRVVRCAVFNVPTDAGWDKPRELGRRLAAFLRQERFGARQAVVGFPGKWVLVKTRALPPAAPAAAAGILRLAVEREYQADAREWAFDFAGDSSSKERTTVLLAATPRQRLTQVTEMLRQARVRVRGVTSTTLMLAMARPAAATPDGAMLHLSADGAELAVRAAGRVVAVERLTAAVVSGATGSLPATPGGGTPPDPAQTAAMGGEIRRVLTQARPGGPGAAERLTIWAANEAAVPGLQSLGGQVGLTAQVNPALHELGVLNGTPEVDRHMPGAAGAVALAQAGLARGRLCVDFRHSRLMADTSPRVTRTRVLAAAAAVMLIGAAVYVGNAWYTQYEEVVALQANLEAMKDPLVKANANLERWKIARGFFDTRPPLLDCLRDVTLAFQRSDQVWATNLAIHDDLTGTLTGKAQDEQAVRQLRDRLSASNRFGDVRLLYSRQGDRDNHAVSFDLTFVYIARKK